MTQTARAFDVIIIGGGLAGASLAVALAPSGLSLAVLEAVAADDAAREQPSFDARTIALTDNARRIYTGMGIWRDIAAHAEPIREIHISERGGFGMTHLHHADAGAAALGYVAPSRVLGEVLHRRIAACGSATLFCPATVEKLVPAEDGHAAVTVSQKQKTRTLKAALVVIADGGRSGLAAQTGATERRRDYPQRAILSIVRTDRPHRGRAFERFTAEGPLALLPHSDKRYALVWTTGEQRAAARMALSDAAFIRALQRAFGDRAGAFADPTPRKCYPLRHSWVDEPIGARTVAIGNAAHSVHPVAGQGFNLGLRDVAVLAETLHDARARGEDIGAAATLRTYAELRRRDTRMVRGFTDGLLRIFGARRAPVALARNLALAGIELCPPAKRLLLRRTMGLAGKPTRLGAGLPLA